VKPEEIALILAAASGVGTSLIQLCKKAGVKCIAVASTLEKLQICKELGADFIIPYKENPDYSSLVKEYTNGKGVNVILDPIMASNFKYVRFL
jgi:NADPH2:quinone reductase